MQRYQTVILGAALIAAAYFCQGCSSATQGVRSFDTPDAAVDALVPALRQNDVAQIKQILGPEAEDIVSSGDEVADQSMIEKFLSMYDAKHSLSNDTDDRATLVVGENDWPMPIPIVREGQGWRFDTAAGKEEIINRRIGRNELTTIEVCRAIVDAQREYAAGDLDGNGAHDFATKFLSEPGGKKGLYWETGAGETPSPLGSLVSAAAEEGYMKPGANTDERPAYHGYHYRILTAQGPAAAGGEGSYLKDGNLTGGFGVIAWPAEYGNSGVMTFIVNQQALVFQCDLGEQTGTMAVSIEAYNPDPQWSLVEESSAVEP